MSAPPLIGLPGRRKTGAQVEGFPGPLGTLELDLYIADYARAVAAAGGLPVHLPLDADPAALVGRLDGLLLTGGADVDPHLYDAAPETDAFPPEPQRDEFELALIAAAEAAGLPVLGICRGLQLLSVRAGGTLHQDVPEHAAFDRPPETELHHVSLADGSTLHRLYGDELAVNSLHHQTLDVIGDDYIVSATAEDGAVEGIEHAVLPIVAVQWHPEMMAGAAEDPVFRWLIGTAS